ncbi:MAG: SRPBCC family protein [Acidimicrobiales bacterium]
MSEHTTQRITIAASPERCFALASDYGSYSSWASDIKQSTVLTVDGEGRGGEVEFRAAAMGRSTHYVLRYNYGSNPLRISWRLMQGDVMQRLDGEYEFGVIDGDPELTMVTYDLNIELAVPLPAFVKRRAEAKIIHTALHEMKARIESKTPTVPNR